MNALFMLLLFALAVQATEAATAFLIKSGTPQCTGDFLLERLTVSCGNECTFGASVDIDGTIYSKYGFSTKPVTLTVKACIFSVICKTLVQEEIYMCDVGLTPTDGQSCPATGSYEYSTSMKLPGDDGQDWFKGYNVGITATFENDYTSTECSLTVKAVKASNSYQMISFSVLGAAVLLTGAAVYNFRHWRRQTATFEAPIAEIDICNHFERMQDASEKKESY